MITPLILAAFAIIANSAGSRLLHEAQWVRRAPGLGIVVWQALSASVVLASVLAGLALAFPVLPVGVSIASLIEACVMALRQQYQTPGGMALSVAGAVFALAIIARVGFCITVALRTARRDRAIQHQQIDSAARYDETWKVSVLEHTIPAVYCIPGRRSKVVFTSGALSRLDHNQMRAVIAHEHAHVRRHDRSAAGAAVRR